LAHFVLTTAFHSRKMAGILVGSSTSMSVINFERKKITAV